MQVRRSSSRKQPRGGFTLIELLVVISIIATLAALILPGVQNAREAARRTQCINNQKNICLAIQTYASARGELPPLSGGIDITLDTGLPGGPASWMVHLLPYFDQQGLYDRLTTTDPSFRAPPNDLFTLTGINVPGYTCPDDVNDRALGASSYVANAGYITRSLWSVPPTAITPPYGGLAQAHRIHAYDYALDGLTGAASTLDNQVAIATGLFFRHDTPNSNATISPGPGRLNSSGLKMTLDRIRDGQSQTIMISENLDTTDRTNNLGEGGWASFATGNLAFGARIEEADLGSPPGTPAQVADNSVPGGVGAIGTAAVPAKPVGLALDPSFALGGNTAADLGASKINARLNLVNLAGTAPRPSSLHPQAVVAGFADGSVKAIQQGIADSVYLRLLSSNGNQLGQEILSGSDF